MRDLTRPTRLLTAVVASVALVATACGDGDSSTDGTDNGSTDGGSTDGGQGTLAIYGSSTVFPVSSLVAEDFGGAATVTSTGSSGGFKDWFCEGLSPINNSSRSIKDSDFELCAENGIAAEDILELKIAVDGMTVMTSADNDSGITCLNLAEIFGLVGPGSGEVATWSDANAVMAEYGLEGHNASLPDVPLATSGPGTESGTYSSFWELALEDLGEEAGFPEEEKFRPDWAGSNSDEVIVQGVEGNQYSFGWVGFAHYLSVQDTVTAFEIADEEGNCVAPTPETIASNEYPLSRDLYIYVNTAFIDDAEVGGTLVDYVDYYLSEGGRAIIDEVGYVQLADDAWEATKAAWESAKA